MSFAHLDPELVEVVAALPHRGLSADNLADVRAETAEYISAQISATPLSPFINRVELHLPGSPSVRVLVYGPRAPAAKLRPAVLWIHGGGYVVGTPEWDDANSQQLVESLGCVVVAPDYRLAPEVLHPGPIDDCYVALQWLHTEAVALGVDRSRIAIAGLSAGAGLCASLALLARDLDQVPVAFQALLQPMLDDRTAVAKPPALQGQLVWLRESNSFGWTSLLGHAPGEKDVSPYAAAARAEDLSGLPPAFVAVGGLDLFLAEDVAYAQRLLEAGVPTELKVYPAACHDFQRLAPQAQVSQQHQRDLVVALRRGLGIEAPAALRPNEDLAANLITALPGITRDEALRFSRHLSCAEPYALGLDSLPREGVPQGTLRAGQCRPGRIYPGVPHDFQVYVPAQYRANEPAALLVCLDGARYLGPEARLATVLDNLIAAGELPPVVAVFVEPGANGPGVPIYGGADNRSVEYDATGDAFARFLSDELLPAATEGLAIRSDPAWRALCGISSGGHAALNAAWERPEAFGRVISHCGSFVALRGGHQLHAAVRQAEARPLRVFLQTGEHDLDLVFGDWELANRQLASALAYRGYEHRLVIGRGGHSLRHGGAILPDTLRWIWSEA